MPPRRGPHLASVRGIVNYYTLYRRPCQGLRVGFPTKIRSGFCKKCPASSGRQHAHPHTKVYLGGRGFTCTGDMWPIPWYWGRCRHRGVSLLLRIFHGCVNHRHDAGFDRLREHRPSVDEGRQVGVDWVGIGRKCAGLRVACRRNPSISRGILRLFESYSGS